jgi:regulator of protease activity HflC (stomatin/prohibitin superfamily)
MPTNQDPTKIIITVVIIAVILVVIAMIVFPQYNVWKRKLGGEAQLREQEYAKQIMVEQAKAELESAKLLREAEVERAKGVAESMSIISEKLEENDNYLQYLAIQAQMKMAESPNHTTVYIPVGPNGLPLIKTIGE